MATKKSSRISRRLFLPVVPFVGELEKRNLTNNMAIEGFTIPFATTRLGARTIQTSGLPNQPMNSSLPHKEEVTSGLNTNRRMQHPVAEIQTGYLMARPGEISNDIQSSSNPSAQILAYTPTSQTITLTSYSFSINTTSRQGQAGASTGDKTYGGSAGQSHQANSISNQQQLNANNSSSISSTAAPIQSSNFVQAKSFQSSVRPFTSGVGPAPILNSQGPTSYVGEQEFLTCESPDGNPGHSILSISYVWTGDSSMNARQYIDEPDGNYYTFDNLELDEGHDAFTDGGFYWGPEVGNNTFDVTANYADGTTGTASISVDVIAAPDVDYDIDGEATKGADAQANIYDSKLQLSSPDDPNNANSISSSMDWSFEASVEGTPGQFAVAQMVTNASATYTTTDNPAVTNTAFVQKNEDGDIIRPLFPLADGNDVFYQPPNEAGTADGVDTPRMPANANVASGSYSIAFKDYLMYCPEHGIWVTTESWTWSENIQENTVIQNGQSVLTASKGANPTFTTLIQDNSYPEWSDYSNNWNTFVTTS